MAAKELTRADFKDVESVVPSPEDRLDAYETLAFLIDFKNNMGEADAEVTRETVTHVWETVKRYGYDIDKAKEELLPSRTEEEREKQRQKEREVMVYKGFAVAKEKARLFISSREERLRSSFCKEYLAPFVLAGMRGGWLINTWWRAVCYGFSVSPSNYDEVEDKSQTEYYAFPYRSLDEMTENDRRAFLWTVEDVYYDMEGRSLNVQLRADKELLASFKEGEETGIYFKPYPKQGYKAEELARQHSSEEYPMTVDELYDSWEYDIELFFPIVLNRQDEAIYYALKYKGTEYLDYIRSLNVEADYDYNGSEAEELDEGEKADSYSKVMTEGYVWHSDK